MDMEEKELLEKSVELAEDNNKILHAMRRSQRISTFIRIIYWTIIIGSAIGAYYVIQPYLEQLGDTYSGFKDAYDSVKSIGR